MIIKPLSTVLSLTTANTVSNATCVFVSASSAANITVAMANGTVRGSFNIPSNQYIFVQKEPTDTVASNIAVLATAAAFRG